MVTCQRNGETWHAALYLRAPGNYGFSGPLEDVTLSTLGTGQGFSINFSSVPSSGVRGLNTDVPIAPRLSHIKQFGRDLRKRGCRFDNESQACGRIGCGVRLPF